METTLVKLAALRGAVALVLLCSSGCGSPNAGEPIEASDDRLIFGTDDRLEYGQVTGNFKRWADSTGALWDPTQFGGTLVQCLDGPLDGVGTCQLFTIPFEKDNESGLRVCEGVRFRSQPQLAVCSGALVGPKLFATAGHCIQTFTCEAGNIVFGFTADANGANAPTTVPEANVYKCVSVQTNPIPTDDWALITLDRPVPRPILNVRYLGLPAVGVELAMTGYPMGIPMKISPTGEVFGAALSLAHNLDAFSANSGSPIFNMETGNVEGIHTNPHQPPPGQLAHWVSSSDSNGPCLIERVCPADGCPGVSHGTLVTNFSNLVPLAPVLIVATTG